MIERKVCGAFEIRRGRQEGELSVHRGREQLAKSFFHWSKLMYYEGWIFAGIPVIVLFGGSFRFQYVHRMRVIRFNREGCPVICVAQVLPCNSSAEFSMDDIWVLMPIVDAHPHLPERA